MSDFKCECTGPMSHCSCSEACITEFHGLRAKVTAQAEELELLKGRNYITHNACGSILETGQITWEEESGNLLDPAIYVICPTCEDIVESGELLNGDNHYLVAKPEVKPL